MYAFAASGLQNLITTFYPVAAFLGGIPQILTT